MTHSVTVHILGVAALTAKTNLILRQRIFLSAFSNLSVACITFLSILSSYLNCTSFFVALLIDKLARNANTQFNMLRLHKMYLTAHGFPCLNFRYTTRADTSKRQTFKMYMHTLCSNYRASLISK